MTSTSPWDPGRPDYAAIAFPPPGDDRPYVIMNMVESLDGRATIEGSERGLGSPSDQRLMRELRVHADVVLNGASTLRASGTSSRLGDPALEEIRRARGKTTAPIAVVLSASGDLPLERPFFTARDFDAVVYLSSGATAERRAAIEATGRSVFVVPEGEEISAMVRHMRTDLGAELLLVEGGPTINGQLFEAGLVDEIFVTVGAVIVGGQTPKTIVEQPRARSLEGTWHLELVSAHPNPETHEIYTRYRVAQRGDA